MVTDDRGSQSEDPLPCRSHGTPSSADNSSAHRSPAFSAADNSAAEAEPTLAPGLAPLAADDASTGRVPLWNRLPRSIWLMSTAMLMTPGL
jgi:hypothetical protein